MFLSFPCVHSKTFAVEGSIILTSSAFFISPMLLFLFAAEDEEAVNPFWLRRSSNAFEVEGGGQLTPVVASEGFFGSCGDV